MFLVAAALVSEWLIKVADLPGKVIGLLEPFMGNKTMIAIMVLCMIVGTAMDMRSTILILTRC